MTAAVRPRLSMWVVVGASAGFAAFMIVLIAAIKGSDSEAATAVVVMGILTALMLPLAGRIARIGGDQRLFAIVMAGFGIKMFASLGRYWFAFIASGGVADASAYDEAGRQLAPAIRQLNFGVDPGGPIPGTGFIRLFTAIVYAVIGSSPIAAFLFYAFLGFLGLLLFWRAFHLAVPEGDSRRYLTLVLFLPSLLFWPSGIGKEAWMVFVLGLCSYGVAGVFTRRPAALALVPGIAGATLVRPHVALLVYCGLMFAFLVRRRPARSAATPAFQILGLFVLLAVGVVMATQTANFLGVESLTLESIDTSLAAAESQTASGGSSFTAVPINSPLDIPLATITVLFRPLPIEANNLQSLIAAAEGVVFMLLVLASWSRVRGVFRTVRRDPYVAYAIGFVVVFIFAFSNFSNFGILARERVQMIPLFLVLLSLPKGQRRAEVSAPHG